MAAKPVDRDPSLDASLRVRCGEPNDCALARGEGDAAEPCWCVSETFPRQLVESVSLESGRERCLCRDCLRRGRVAARGAEESA